MITPVMSDYRIEGARTLLIERDGAPYHLHLFVPASPPPASGWPVLLLLDASGCFATAVEALTRMSRRPDATGVSPMLIVGISSASGHDIDRRQWDFTTARPDSPAHKRSGGAPAFLDFLDQTILPLIGNHAPVDSNRLTLFGHSLAGYFALWALTSGRPPFQRYCAASPSIWWDRPLLTEALANLRQTDRRLVMLMGAWEEELPPWQALEPNAAEVRARRKQRDMLGAAQAFTDDLARRVGEERARYIILPEEDHASILSAAITRALRLAALP